MLFVVAGLSEGTEHGTSWDDNSGHYSVETWYPSVITTALIIEKAESELVGLGILIRIAE